MRALPLGKMLAKSSTTLQTLAVHYGSVRVTLDTDIYAGCLIFIVGQDSGDFYGDSEDLVGEWWVF